MSLAEIPAIAQLRDPNRYHILGEHGRGGLGRVARAHDVELGRDIAIKELISRGPISELRFLREALITARLEHPGIVPVHEAGRWPDGTPFYAMKLVAGRPLRDLIAERLTIDDRIGLLHHVIAVADAIAYAHGRNIIHRDLKPSNVIVGDYGETVVIDWGLAKELSATEEPAIGTGSSAPASSFVSSDDGLTSAGTVLGTPAYMAPEQARGESVDKRADVFAIGAMLWELCTLEKLPPAFTGQRRGILRRAGIDQDLVTIVVKAIDPDSDRRYSDAGALAADLKAFKAGARIAARRYSLLARLAHWTRRHRTAAVTIVCATVVALTGIWFYIHDVGAERDRTEFARNVAQDAKAAAATALSEKRVADARASEAALEQGRAALLHHEPEAQARLTEAYEREPSASTAFMLARAMQPRLGEEARFASTFGRMWSAAFSPDGAQIVTTDDRAVQLWDGRTHQRLATLPHDGSEVYDAVYSVDGTMLVTVAQMAVRIWDPRRGVLVRELHARAQSGVALDYFRAAISADGRFVAVIDSIGSVVNVWNTATGDLLAELRRPPAGSPSLAFGRDGWLATSAGDDAYVFDVRSWAQVRRLPGPVRSLAFNSRSQLVTGATTGDVTLWDVRRGLRLRQLHQAGEVVDVVAFSWDGQFIAAGSRDGVIQVWHAASGALRSQLNPRHGKILMVEFDRTGTLLLAAHSDGTVVVVDAVQGLPVALFEGPRGVVRFAHFDPRASRVVAASWDGTARLWRVDSLYRRWTTDPISDKCGGIDVNEARGRYVAVDCADHPVRIWDTARDHLLVELPSVTHVADDRKRPPPIVSAEGDRAAIARGNTVHLYELPVGRLLRTISHSGFVTAVAFAPVGRDMISGAADGSILISHDDGTLRTLPTVAGVDAVALLSDGRAIVADAQPHLRVYTPGGVLLADLKVPVRMTSLRGDGTRVVVLPSFTGTAAPPILLDVESYRVVELVGHLGIAWSARWVAGKRVLTAGSDGTARMWDGITGRQVSVYRGGTRFLADATLLNDGIVIAADADGLLRFWDAAGGARLWTLQAHKSSVVSVHVENGDVVSHGFTGEISRWHLPPAEEVIEACRHRPSCAVVAE